MTSSDIFSNLRKRMRQICVLKVLSPTSTLKLFVENHVVEKDLHLCSTSVVFSPENKTPQ